MFIYKFNEIMSKVEIPEQPLGDENHFFEKVLYERGLFFVPGY
jgi:hypothetical protein